MNKPAQLAMEECFPDAVIHHNNLWNELNHQQVFACYELRFEQPELLKADVVKEYNLASVSCQNLLRRYRTMDSDGDFHHEYDESWPHFKTDGNGATATL